MCPFFVFVYWLKFSVGDRVRERSLYAVGAREGDFGPVCKGAGVFLRVCDRLQKGAALIEAAPSLIKAAKRDESTTYALLNDKEPPVK